MVWFLRARRERRLAELDDLRRTRKLVEEDVTAFGEQLSDLHVETLTTELDSDMRFDYQRSLDRYEDAKTSLREAATPAAVIDVAGILDEGRFHLACVLARRDGLALPTRREPCFFNPQHGPAVADVAWTPPGGVERKVPVCRSDERRITGGEDPEVRLVRLGDRYVPWYAARPLEPGSALSGPGAALDGRRAHVFGRATPDTDRSIAEAHVRASNQNTGFPGAGGI